MAQTSRSNKGDGQKPQGEARPQGRKNVFSGTKLEFLESYKDQFLDSTDDRSGFYTWVAKGFIKQFGYILAIEDNSEPCDNDGDHTPEDVNSLLPLDEQNLESA